MFRTKGYRRLMLAGTAGVLALLGGHGAFAAAADSSPTNVEEVVVTAEKRSVNIQQVPASVSAISGSKLETLGLKNLQDYSQYVPGLVVNQGGSPGQTTVTLRGVAAVGPGSVVGYYIDDTPLGSSGNYARATAFSLDLLPYDVERLEVLRGPQGTLYGAGAMGGLIKYVLKQANTHEYSLQAGTELSYIDHSDGMGNAFRAAANIPLIQDKLGVRISGFEQQDQGYVDNVRLGIGDANDLRQWGGRLAVTFTPTDKLTVNLNALWYRLHSQDNNTVRLDNLVTHTEPNGGEWLSGTPTLGEFAQTYGFRQPFTKNIDYYSATVNYDLGAATLTSATSYSETKTAQRQDSTDLYGAYTQLFGMPHGVGVFDLGLGLDKFTQEFRLASPSGGKVEWLAGAYYTYEKSNNHQLVNVYDANYQPITGPFAAFFNPFFAYAELPSDYREYAAFGDLTVHLTDKFDVTGGLRYAHNDQNFEQISDGLVLGGFTDQPGDSSESVLTYQANARYHFTDDSMLYARIASGYRPGGPNATLNAKPTPPVGSDKLTSYEVGLKSTFLNGRLLFNAAVFDIEWKNIQQGVYHPDTGSSNLANAGDAFSRGVEIDGYFMPVEGLRIGYDAAYTKAQLTSIDTDAPPFFTGVQLPGIPKWQAGLTADYQWPLSDVWRANVGAGFHYISEEWTGGLQDPSTGSLLYSGPTTKNPAYSTLDLHMGLSTDRYDINLFVRNVTDKRVYLQSFPVSDPFIGNFALDTVLLQPRTIGISFDAKF